MAAETSYTSARANLAKLCDQVAESLEPVFIRRRGAADVALVSADELRSLLETAHLLRSPKNARRLLTALARAESGAPDELAAGQSLDELRQEIGVEPRARTSRRRP